MAVCAIARCENRYLQEWVSDWLEHGVNKIFIYDNGHGNEERPETVLVDWIKQGKVEIIGFRDVGGDYNAQDEAYNDFYQRHGDDYAWIGFFDIDELIEFEDQKQSIPDLLNSFKDADAVAPSPC